MSDIEIEIDGKKILTDPSKMVIQVADDEGIYIPRFCYHKHLSIAANCRMCLVEVEKSPKPLPACATPVMPGMKIFTRSSKALAAQRAVMEFLLINHPLDCPICDQGGECELQDLSMGYGKADSYYTEGKRAVKDEDLGPLIATEMTRCILCTRCVRFGDEVAGMRELGVIERGEHAEISTYIEKSIHSEVSGNIIDLCPVGALTSKPFRFSARAWELQQYPTIAPHDCLGSNLNAHTRTGTVMRVVPRENNAINQTWISDRDRFSYEGLYHADRLTTPLIRKNGKLEKTDWKTALEVAMQGIQQVLNKSNGDQLAALASPSSTVEEFYLLQKLARSLGSSHVDHRLRQADFSDQQNRSLFPGLALPIAELENCDVIVLIGSNIQKEQPIASLRVRKATLKGAKVIALNMMDYNFNFKVTAKKITAPALFPSALANIDQTIVDLLQAGKKVCVLLGASAINHPQASVIHELARRMAERCNATMGVLTEGANSAGAWLAGMIPHRLPAGKSTKEGLHAQGMWDQPRKAYLLLNVEPDLDCANPVAAVQALKQAECVVSLSLYQNPVLNEYATVILPMAAFTETSGTLVNTTGEWQSFKGVASGFGESRPAWKILRVLANFLHCDGFDYETSEHVRDELKTAMVTAPQLVASPYEFNAEKLRSSDGLLTRIGEIPIYATDSLVRHASALQATQSIIEGSLASVAMHPDTANKLNIKESEQVMIKQNGARVRFPVVFNSRVPHDAVCIAGGIPAAAEFSGLFATLEIEKV